MRMPLIALLAFTVTTSAGMSTRANAQTPSPSSPRSSGPSPAPSQAPSSAPASPAPKSGARPAAAVPVAAVDPYTYNAEGRRDPFMSLLATGSEPALPTSRVPGPPGLGVGDISVRGVVQGPNGLVALVQGPDNKTYVVHQGEKFRDGTVKAVTPQGLVIVQAVTDPLSPVKQREIRKQLLRGGEGARP